TLDGSLSGSSMFVGTSSVASVDTPATGVVLLTGDNRIETEHGVLFTKDAIVLDTVGDGTFAEIDVIVGGTDRFAGATGTLTGSGTFANGAGDGTLVGEICVP